MQVLLSTPVCLPACLLLWTCTWDGTQTRCFHQGSARVSPIMLHLRCFLTASRAFTFFMFMITLLPTYLSMTRDSLFSWTERWGVAVQSHHLIPALKTNFTFEMILEPFKLNLNTCALYALCLWIYEAWTVFIFLKNSYDSVIAALHADSQMNSRMFKFFLWFPIIAIFSLRVYQINTCPSKNGIWLIVCY